MIRLEAPFRRATLADAPALAELVNLAGEGLPLYLWEQIAEPGETAWDVGRRRARREEGGFSYRNAVLAEAPEGAVAGCLIGYPLPDDPPPLNLGQTPPLFAPLEELEHLAPGTWYVNVLAVYPEHRGRGLGASLLALADALATAAGKKGTSLIVANANAGARRLYERCGYRLRAERAMVKEGWRNPGRSWLLLVKEAPAQSSA